jgi:hypothetical protein
MKYISWTTCIYIGYIYWVHVLGIYIGHMYWVYVLGMYIGIYIG